VSAPALPEAFGNYALGDFVEVVSPQAVSWLPQTPGWWIVGIGALALTLRYGWHRLRHWYRNRYRREAVARLQQISAQASDQGLLTEINKLLKLTAMAAYSRARVASLYGEEWTLFLNRQCAQPPFTPEQSRCLAHGPYRALTLTSTSRDDLLAASLAWVQQHRSNDDV